MPLHAVIPLLQEVTEYTFHSKVLMLWLEDENPDMGLQYVTSRVLKSAW